MLKFYLETILKHVVRFCREIGTVSSGGRGQKEKPRPVPRRGRGQKSLCKHHKDNKKFIQKHTPFPINSGHTVCWSFIQASKISFSSIKIEFSYNFFKIVNFFRKLSPGPRRNTGDMALPGPALEDTAKNAIPGLFFPFVFGTLCVTYKHFWGQARLPISPLKIPDHGVKGWTF